MIIKLQNGDKMKMESDEKREARRKYKEYSQLSIGQKLKRNLNIASNFLRSGPNITNFGNAISALFGGFSPENPDINKGDPPNVGIKDFARIVKTARVAREFKNVIDKGLYRKSPFGWQERIKVQSTPEITRSKPYVRWSQKGYLNETYNIEGGPGQKFLVVKDVDNPQPGVLNTKGNGEYSLHFHSTKDNPNKEEMFQALAESIPEGGKVSTWGTISKGGYHGINRFGEQFGWPKVGERPAVNGPVNIFQKPTVSQDSKQDAIIFDNGYRTVPYPAYINHVWKVLKEKGIRTEPFNRSNTNEQTLTNFFNKGFTPVFKLYPGNNTKNQAQETLRRMQNFGMDIDNTMGELPGYGKRSIRDLVTLNSGRTSYVGYYDKSGTLGSYFPNSGVTIIDPGYRAGYNGDFIIKMASTMQHERNMHGTEKLLTPEMWKPYENFISSIFKDIKVQDNGGKKVMFAVTQDGLEAPINKSSLLKQEARATLGELRKKIYDTKAYELAIKDNQQVKKGDVEKLRPYFEKAVDEMDKYELKEELSKLNDYGRDYAAIGPINSSTFFNDLRELLKIAPATIPFLIPGKEEKK